MSGRSIRLAAIGLCVAFWSIVGVSLAHAGGPIPAPAPLGSVGVVLPTGYQRDQGFVSPVSPPYNLTLGVQSSSVVWTANTAALNQAFQDACVSSPGGKLILPNAHIDTNGPLDFRATSAGPGCLILSSEEDTIIDDHATSGAVLMVGGHFQTLQGGITVEFSALPAATGAPIATDGTGQDGVDFYYPVGSYYTNIHAYNTARAFAMPLVNASAQGCTNCNKLFSTTMGNLYANAYSYRAYDFQTSSGGAPTGGSTGNFFYNLYSTNGGVGVNVPFVMTGFTEGVVDQLNIESVKCNAVVSGDTVANVACLDLSSDGALTLNSVHNEFVTTSYANGGLIYSASGDIVTIGSLTIANSTFSGVTPNHVLRMFGTDNHVVIGKIYDLGTGSGSPNTLGSSTLDLAYAPSALTRSTIDIGPIYRNTTPTITLTGNTVPTADLKVIRQVDGMQLTNALTANTVIGAPANTINVTPNSQVLYAAKFYLPHPTVIDNMQAGVIAAQSGSQCRAGIYYADGSLQPAALVKDYGVIATTAVGAASTATSAATYRTGWYWKRWSAT